MFNLRMHQIVASIKIFIEVIEFSEFEDNGMVCSE